MEGRSWAINNNFIRVQFKGFACTYFLCSMKNVDAVSSSVALLSCQEMQQQHQEFPTAPNPSCTAASTGIQAEMLLEGKEQQDKEGRSDCQVWAEKLIKVKKI